MTPLRPQLQTIADRQRLVIADAHKYLAPLSDTQLRWTPDSRWSIVQIADHLVRTHAAMNPLFEKAIADAPMAGDERSEELRYPLMDRLMVKALSPGTKVKLKVPKIFEPEIPNGPASVVIQELQKQLEAFLVLLGKADEKQMKGIRVASPAGKGIRPTIIAYLDATVQHNRYHWAQIELLLQDAGFPPSGS
jgi:hypothetical protein